MNNIHLIAGCIIYIYGIVFINANDNKNISNNGKTTTTVSTNKTGQHTAETIMTGDKDGYVIFKNNNKVISVAPLRNGELHGTQVVFYETGEIDRFVDFHFGKPTGNSTSFYKNKNIKTISKITENGDVSVLNYDEEGNPIKR